MGNEEKIQEIIDSYLPLILRDPYAYICIGRGYESFNRYIAIERIENILQLMGYTPVADKSRFVVSLIPFKLRENGNNE